MISHPLYLFTMLFFSFRLYCNHKTSKDATTTVAGQVTKEHLQNNILNHIDNKNKTEPK